MTSFSGKTNTAGKAKAKAQDAVAKLPPLSPNPMTNLLITDIAMKVGGGLARRALQSTLLGAKYSDQKAKDIVKGRTLTQTLITTAVARIATRSVPGALLVGGGLLAAVAARAFSRRRGGGERFYRSDLDRGR